MKKYKNIVFAILYLSASVFCICCIMWLYNERDCEGMQVFLGVAAVFFGCGSYCLVEEREYEKNY